MTLSANDWDYEAPQLTPSRNAAESALARLRKLPASHPYVQEELLGILEQIEHEKTQKAGSYLQIIRESFGPSNRRRLLTGMLIMVSFQMSGVSSSFFFPAKSVAI